MDLSTLCNKAIEIIKDTGQFLVEEARGFKKQHIEKKGLNDLVSYVDKEAERRLVLGLATLVPDAGFIAEEGTGEKNPNGYNWIIDPLDGTTNFIHGLPFYAVSVALADQDGTLLIGIVYEPNRDECFYATQHGKAYCNDTEIKVSDTKQLADGLFATGFPYYNFEKMPQYLQTVGELMQKSHGLRRCGSAALDLAYVAAGRFEGFYEYNLNAWDVAAGVLIVRRAGGIATTFENTADCVFGRELLAANRVHPELLEIIQRNFRIAQVME